MYKVKYLSLICILILSTGCTNRVKMSQQDKIAKQETPQTIQESSLVGKILVGTLTFLGTKNIESTLKSIKAGGNAVGYFAGEKLSNMQKRYKEKEEKLITNILLIDQESTELKERNSQLITELLVMQEQIDILEENIVIKENQKQVQKASIKSKLQKKKKSLEVLLVKNKQVSKKILFSKTKANEYEYNTEDKKEILQSVAFLEKSSQTYEQNINQNISSINKMISTL